MLGFNFQYFCYFVANLTRVFSWVVFGLLPALSKVRLSGQMVPLCSGWLQSQGEWERTEVRTDPTTTVASISCCFYCRTRPVCTGCSVCTGWASDAAEMLEQSHLGMWWKLSTSACAVWWAGHAGKGMARVKVVPIDFFSSRFFTMLRCFPSLWELWKLVTQPWITDGSWLAAWVDNGWRERWRRVVLKLWRK